MRKTIKVIEEAIREQKATCKIFKDINVSLYNCNVVIFKGEEAKKYLKIHNIKDLSNCTLNKLEKNGDIVICFQKSPYKSTIIHELTHATQMIMHFIGHNHYKEFDEPFAYLLGFLVKKYYE